MTGEIFNFTLELLPVPRYNFFRIDPGLGGGAGGRSAGNRSAGSSTEGGGVSDGATSTAPPSVAPQLLSQLYAPAAYIHSFASTKNFLVLVVWPYYFTLNGMFVWAGGGGMREA